MRKVSGIDQAGDEGDTTLWPASMVDEGRENICGAVVLGCRSWNCNDSDQKG